MFDGLYHLSVRKIVPVIVALFAFSIIAVGQADPSAKRNERPKADSKKADPAKGGGNYSHRYEFDRPGFGYGHIVIEHDEAGKGTISFLKHDHDESITDPIQLSKRTLEKIESALAELKFLDSSEEYQHARDFTHMGNITFTLRREARSRTVKYNWTEVAGAKAIMDEYRRIANEYTWRFEITLARENMPLQTPGLMDALEAYLRRSEISDPPNLLPFLGELANDERLPLMARNRASKLIKEIGKARR